MEKSKNMDDLGVPPMTKRTPPKSENPLAVGIFLEASARTPRMGRSWPWILLDWPVQYVSIGT